jgi:5-formyltetrahydrofolate cyclo-ligase
MSSPTKSEIRKEFLEKRLTLPIARRKKAEACLISLSLKPGVILSYMAIKGELNLQEINIKLAAEGRLALPRVDGQIIIPYLVTEGRETLQCSSWGILEPVPELCRRLPPADLAAILVPGLAFDSDHHRLGYGKGYYDRLLKKATSAHSYGVGFTEQLTDQLPRNLHDHPLDELLLF